MVWTIATAGVVVAAAPTEPEPTATALVARRVVTASPRFTG